MRLKGLVFAVAVLGAGPASAGEEDPSRISVVAGGFGGVAESCGLDTQAYSRRVEELLKHMAGNSDEAEQLIASYNSHKEETAKREENERTIDCMDAKRRFEELPINHPAWTVDTGWASEML